MLKPLAQIIPVPDGASVGLAIALLVVSVVAFAAGLLLVFRGARGPRGRTAWLMVASGLTLCAGSLLLWGRLGFLGRKVEHALQWPTRRSWDLSSGNEIARLGEKRLAGYQAWGGSLEFTIALPSERKLAGRARFVSIDNREGQIQRLTWRSADTRDPCALLHDTAKSLRLRADTPASACRERVSARDPLDPQSPAWTVCSSATEMPRITAEILGSFDPKLSDHGVVAVTVVWDRRFQDPLVNLPACPCDRGGTPSCTVADLRSRS